MSSISKSEREENAIRIHEELRDWSWMQEARAKKHLSRIFHGPGRRMTVRHFRQLVYQLGGFPRSTSMINSLRKALRYNKRDNTVLISYADVRLLTHPDEELYWAERRDEYGEETIRRDVRYRDYIDRVNAAGEKAADGLSLRKLKQQYAVREADEEMNEAILRTLLQGDLREDSLEGRVEPLSRSFIEDASRDLHEEMRETD